MYWRACFSSIIISVFDVQFSFSRRYKYKQLTVVLTTAYKPNVGSICQEGWRQTAVLLATDLSPHSTNNNTKVDYVLSDCLNILFLRNKLLWLKIEMGTPRYASAINLLNSVTRASANDHYILTALFYDSRHQTLLVTRWHGVDIC